MFLYLVLERGEIPLKLQPRGCLLSLHCLLLPCGTGRAASTHSASLPDQLWILLCFPMRPGLDPALLSPQIRSGSCFAFPRHQVWKSLPLSSPSLSCPNHFHLTQPQNLTSLRHRPGFSLCTFIKNHPVEDPRFLLQLAARTRAPAATGLEVPRGNTVPSNLTSSPPGITWLPGFLWVSRVLGHPQMSPASPQDTPNTGEWFALPGFCLILPFPSAHSRLLE